MPLIWAPRQGNEGCVDSLLKRKGVNPNLLIKFSWNHSGVLQNICTRAPEAAPARGGGTTPTSKGYLAIQLNISPKNSKNSHDSIITLLLQLSYVNPGASMERFIKPHKHKGIVKLLLVGQPPPARPSGRNTSLMGYWMWTNERDNVAPRECWCRSRFMQWELLNATTMSRVQGDHSSALNTP